jgi:penicillin V acylase-like amidase (Ntn superfamily)
VIVNPRGIATTALAWRRDRPVIWPGDLPAWESAYASIAFTCYGRDFIEAGMNEAGLVIEQASLGSARRSVDERPGVSCAQWMQYCLDTCSSVSDIRERMDRVRPEGEGWHYLVADAAGRVAVIEHLKGRPTVYAGNDLPYPIITNTAWVSATGAWAAIHGDDDAGAIEDKASARVARHPTTRVP